MPDGMTYRQSLEQAIKAPVRFVPAPQPPVQVPAPRHKEAAAAFARAAVLAAAAGDPMMAAYLRDLAMNRRIAAKQRSA